MRFTIEFVVLTIACAVALPLASCHARGTAVEGNRGGSPTGAGRAGAAMAAPTKDGGAGQEGGPASESAGVAIRAARSAPPVNSAACTLPRQRRGWQLISCCGGALCQGQCIDGQCVCVGEPTRQGCQGDAVCCASGGCTKLAPGEDCRGGPP